MLTLYILQNLLALTGKLPPLEMRATSNNSDDETLGAYPFLVLNWNQ
jgi:hypothetical protein